MVADILIYFVVGLAGGAVAGLIGTGSSTIILPALVYLLPHLLQDQVLGLHIAIATCMATIFVTALAVSYQYLKAGLIDWRLVKLLLPTYIVGPLIGAWISSKMPGEWLKIYIGMFIVFAGAKMLFHPPADNALKHLPATWLLLLMSLLITVLSSMAGVAIGLMMVPLLHHYGIKLKVAMHVSLISAVLYTFFGAVGYIIEGWDVIGLPQWSFGYVYLPAFICVSIGVVVTAPVLAKVSIKMDANKLKMFFALFLCVAGLNLIIMTFV